MFDNYRIILASQSPRRRELLKGLDIDFTVELSKDEKEVFSDDIPRAEVPEFLARHKSESFHRSLEADEVLITADTLVFCPHDGGIRDSIPLGKPRDREEALSMLRLLSGRTHYVLTGVVIRTVGELRSFTCTTEVTFRPLKESEIAWYVDTYKPYDKAGAYGVQEWIGYAAISSINGSYYNVVGLPVERLFTELTDMLR